MDVVHGEQVVSMAQLEAHDLESGLQLGSLPALLRPALLHHVLHQQVVLADSLHWLQQVRQQVHLISQLQLLVLHSVREKDKHTTGHTLHFTWQKSSKVSVSCMEIIYTSILNGIPETVTH